MTDTAARDALVRTTVLQTLAIDPDTVTDTTELEAFDFDSLDCVEVTMELEDTLSVRIDDDEALACKTIADWQDLVARKSPA